MTDTSDGTVSQPVARPPQRRAEVVELVLAERYPLLLDGMRHAFTPEKGFRIVAACADGQDALLAVRRHHPDLLVIDLDISGDALEILRALAADRLRTRVVLLAGELDEAVMLEAMRLGAKGIVLKSMSRQMLEDCVRKVHRGGTWLERVALGRAIDQIVRREAGYRGAAGLLSQRELEVVRMAVGGGSSKEIADALGICDGTVKVHLHHVYEKLGVKGRLELTLYARDTGLFSRLDARPPKRPR